MAVMCGRYGRTSSLEAIQVCLDSLPPITEAEDWQTTYNAAPGVTQPIVRVKPEGAGTTIRPALWGLLPFWAKSPSAKRLINAKAETAHELPAFRQSFERRRCLVPADWFYEWQETPSGKIPYCVRMASQEPFFFAGLWDTWHAGRADALHSFAILTTEPNELAAIHNRMPVIVQREDYARWLDPMVKNLDKLSEILAPYPAEEMMAYRIGPLVNNVKNDGPQLIEPLER
jgi:putative SOS response-associated peptidase YedK